MNRCIAYNINNNKCRLKIHDNQLFCCESHYPINKDIIEQGCFICYQKEFKSNELIYLKCKHAFHKECYQEWLEHSTYETPVCILCLRIVFTHLKEKKQFKKINIEKELKKEILQNIKKILN